MQRLVECVPNLSEGRNQATLDAIAQVMRTVPGVELLHVDSDPDAHRSVFTLLGEPKQVCLAVRVGIRTALKMIDLRNHEGVHPRIGVVDVVPFVPWRNLRLEDCVNLARSFAGQIAEEFALPVYLYGQAAIRPQTNRLASIRRGSLADLAKRMTTAALRPDFGPQQLDLRHGAIAIGARDIMIAYNIEIATKDLTIAELIAARIRTSGSSRFGRPGLLPALQAIGWYLPSRGVVQVSTNILDYQTTPLHQVFQVVGDLAREYGCRVQSSEIVGMLPLAALLQTGRTLIADANILEEELIDKTIDYLGLSSRQPFAPSKRIIEYALRTRHA